MAPQVKLLDAPLVCPTSGCAPVLNSPYSEVFGVPLSVLGEFSQGLHLPLVFWMIGVLLEFVDSWLIYTLIL